MKIKRFFAADIRQAMRMVKEELGADAVIMSNRAVEGGIEIVAARDFDEQSIHNKLQEQAAGQRMEPKIKSIVFPVLDEAKKQPLPQNNPAKNDAPVIAKLAPAVQSLTDDKPQHQAAAKAPDLSPTRMVLPNFDAAKKRLHLENERKTAAAALAAAQQERKFTSPYIGYAEKAELIKNTEVLAARSAATQAIKHQESANSSGQNNQASIAENMLMEMSKELKQLRSAMDNKFATISWVLNPEAATLRNGLNQRLLDMGFSKKLSGTLASQLVDENNTDLAFAKAQEMLEQALPIADDKLLETGGIVALVGPTGVGKTTTIAKLAAKFILKHGSSSQVALITTDNYRIGAHDQLNTYGRILNVPVRVASCADDLRNLIANFSDKRLILIDTAGMCQHNLKLVEQINTLQQSGLAINSYLVMSAATEYKAMNSIIKAFSVFNPQAAILTKLDEAVMIGSSISSIIEHNLPLSFITNGQQVPEDFHHPDAHALIEQCAAGADAEADDEDEQGYQPWGEQAYA